MEHIRARNTNPITSFMAADQAKDLSKQHSILIVQCLQIHGPLGKDGIAKRTGLDGNQVARRLNELLKEGLICLTGNQVKSNSGRMEREWTFIPVQVRLL
jgi:DNA-binding transcriptional regulator LsrR (DeoR family)